MAPEIFVEYETICVNCKEKGYSFGYSFKTIEYKGTIALDLPQKNLNGPSISFEFEGIPRIIHSVENSYNLKNNEGNPSFLMINAKKGLNNQVSKFTYLYIPRINGKIDHNLDYIKQQPSKLYQYVDMYEFSNKPYILMFYSYKFDSNNSLKNFNFYQFYDFDIYGQDAFDSDRVCYDPQRNLIYQFDDIIGIDKSLIAGIGTLDETPPIRFEGNTPEDILISEKQWNLKNISSFGPSDCALGLQWTSSELRQNKLVTFPIMMVFGEGIKNFNDNYIVAKAHLAKLNKLINKSVNDKFRQKVDPKLSEMGFSRKKWC
jgi:hypothetical protein